MNDQMLFAGWSGDRNPLHVSEIEARRLISGHAVVHGMHLVLESLARWAPHATGAARSIKAEFLRPVNVGDEVQFRANDQGRSVQLVAEVDGQPSMALEVREDASSSVRSLPPQGEPPVAASVPLNEPIETWAGRVLALPAVSGSMACVESVGNWLGRPATDALGQLSTLVGMMCPGLHSIFSSFEVDVRAEDGIERSRVLRHDPRFRLVEVEVDGPLRGRVRAFQRPPPQPQPTMQSLLDLVSRDQFAGSHSWVLGGSRGLGETAAKLISAGGGDVTLTYALGREDAQRVVDDIQSAGRGRAMLSRYEVGADSPAELCTRLNAPDAVFFFASPRIGRRRSSAFDPALFYEFVRYYVDELHRLVAALQVECVRRATGRTVQVFNPSSVFVDELPNGMVEYAMAKSASEVLAQDLNKRLSHVRTSSVRLPRMLTDQTAGLLPSKAADAKAVLLPIVRGLLQKR